jgi:ankyrin repeat protein
MSWTNELFEAIRNQDLETLRRSIENRKVPVNTSNSAGRSLLLHACDCGSYRIVKYLIEQGADIHQADDQGVTPLMLALWENHEAIVRLLLQQQRETSSLPISPTSSPLSRPKTSIPRDYHSLTTNTTMKHMLRSSNENK